MKQRFYALVAGAFGALVATVAINGLSATKLNHGVSLATIGGLSDQVINSNDLCNGYLLDGCPVAINDQRLIDQQAWLVEETGATSVSYATMRNDCVVAGAQCLAFQPTSIIFHKGDAVHYTTDIRGVVISSAATRIALLQAFGVRQSDIALKWYPGFEARHPSQGNPIGDPWPEHPYTKLGRKMFHSIDPRNRFSPGSEFQFDQRRWIKWRSQISPGAGPFGIGGEVADAWEETTLR